MRKTVTSQRAKRL